MRRKGIVLLVAFALLLVFVLPPPVLAVNSEIQYTVTYVCICLGCYGMVVGEWTRACDGSMYGWGVQPYEPASCYSTAKTYGDMC